MGVDCGGPGLEKMGYAVERADVEVLPAAVRRD